MYIKIYTKVNKINKIMKESGIFPSENCSFSSQNYSIDFDYENYNLKHFAFSFNHGASLSVYILCVLHNLISSEFSDFLFTNTV